TIILMTIIFITSWIIALIIIRRTISKNGQISRRRIIIVMTILYFIVHPLGFYIYWGHVLNFRSDGQLIFAAVDSYPKSGWTFILIGLSIDGVKNYKLNGKH